MTNARMTKIGARSFVIRHSSFVIWTCNDSTSARSAAVHLPAAAPARIGLMAGWGRYPLLVVEALRRQGSEVYCLGVVGHADPKLAEICQDFQWSGLGRFGAAIRYFKRHAVTDVIMAGKIHKVVLFKPWMIVRNMPDLRTIRMFIPHFLTRKKDNKDDTLLGAIVAGVRPRGHALRPADRLRRRASGEQGPVDPPRPVGLAVEGHPLRLEAGQGDGPAGRGPERGGEGPGRAGDRGRRRHRRVHPPRGRACAVPAGSPWSRWPSRSRTCATTCRPSA